MALFDISSLLRANASNFNSVPIVAEGQTIRGIAADQVIVTRTSREKTIDKTEACHFEAMGAYFVPNASLEKIYRLPTLIPKWPQAQQIFTGVEYQKVVSKTDSSFILHQATGEDDDEMQYVIQLDAHKLPHGFIFSQQLHTGALQTTLQDSDGEDIKAAPDVLKKANGKTEVLLTQLQDGDKIIPGALIFIQFESDMLRESPSTEENMMGVINASCETAVGNSALGAASGTVAHHIEERLRNIAELIQEDHQ